MALLENLWFNCALREYKIEKLATERLTSMEYLLLPEPSFPILYSLKAPENLWFLVFSGGIKWKNWLEMGY